MHTPITTTDIESRMLAMPQAACEVQHRFEPGHYIRELRMPAGTLAIGHYQNFSHINVFVSGRVMMLNADGTTQILTAPQTFIGAPGRKIGYVLEDMVWQNIYSTDETDVEVLEAHLLTRSDAFLSRAAHEFALNTVARESDRLDYESVRTELGFTEQQVQEQVQNTQDQIEIDLFRVELAISPIHGTGVFASCDIGAGELIGPSRFGNMRTQLGRYTNHSSQPNAEMHTHGSDVYLVASRDISGRRGGLPGEEITVDYRTVIKLLRG
jgi:hypothetical protein